MDAERARRVFAPFVLRARRVEAHSLAADTKVLSSLCNPQYLIEDMDFDTGEATVARRFPPEGQVESAAARVRPITLEGDPVHWGKAPNALGFLLHDAGTFESYRQAIKVAVSTSCGPTRTGRIPPIVATPDLQEVA